MSKSKPVEQTAPENEVAEATEPKRRIKPVNIVDNTDAPETPERVAEESRREVGKMVFVDYL